MMTFSNWLRSTARHHVADESGAVTVDWVALTAALCAMILMVFSILTDAVVRDTATVVADRVLTASSTANW